jgi:hypothetical protein
MFETIIGGLIGGIFRVIPEVMTYFDKKNERAHELSMQDKQVEFEKIKGAQKMDEIGASNQGEWNQGYLNALKEAISVQGQKTGYTKIDAFNALMRPLIAFQWVILLYPASLIATFVLNVLAGADPLVTLLKVFGPDERAIAAGIINFFFLNRVFDKTRV